VTLRTRYLPRYHGVVPPTALIAPFARVARSTPDHGEHRCQLQKVAANRGLICHGYGRRGDVVDLDYPPFVIDVEAAVPPARRRRRSGDP
jgi:hypothetical protein